MKIECPSCRLAGNINELELPPEGGLINCPRCKERFHVAKPAPTGNGGPLMNTCPVCRYSTFTDDMFSVCPKCGATGNNYKQMLKKNEEAERISRVREKTERSARIPEPDMVPPMAVEDIPHSRSLRNPDLFIPPPLEEGEPPKPRAPEPVRITGGLSAAAGAAFLVFGIAGLANYYAKDWQAILSEPLLEQVSKTRIFFSLGFLPWLRTLFGLCLAVVASWFLMLRKGSQRWLTLCAWGGVALGAINEIVEFVKWAAVSSDSPSFAYYAVGAISSLFMIIPWAAPFLILIWFLQRECILREFPECNPDPLLFRLLAKLPFIVQP